MTVTKEEVTEEFKQQFDNETDYIIVDVDNTFMLVPADEPAFSTWIPHERQGGHFVFSYKGQIELSQIVADFCNAKIEAAIEQYKEDHKFDDFGDDL